MDVTKDAWAYVSRVKPMPDYQLSLVFRDGRRGVYDMSPLLAWPVYAPLKSAAVFDSVRVDGGTAAWPGDIDIAPEELYYNCTPTI